MDNAVEFILPVIRYLFKNVWPCAELKRQTGFAMLQWYGNEHAFMLHSVGC
jgi:hypothetical protein